MISSPAPNSFKHVTHIGVGEDGVFEASSELDESWKGMLANLQGYGVTEEVVTRHSEFVEGFWKGVEAARDVDVEQTEGEQFPFFHVFFTNSILSGSDHPERDAKEIDVYFCLVIGGVSFGKKIILSSYIVLFIAGL